MARSPAKPPAAAQLTPGQMRQGIDRLRRRLTDLETLDVSAISTGHEESLRALEAAIAEALDRTFGAGSADLKRYEAATHLQKYESLIMVSGYEPPRASIAEIQEEVSGKRDGALALIRQAVRGLEEELEAAEPSATAAQHRQTTTSRRVFVVHGHDGTPREAVARFLERINFEPIILHEQANRGRTIIEKVEAHNDVGFAVVLLTPDDVGGSQGGELRPRARQNVVLELGYFLGTLGRDRVCALRRGEVEIPADFAGVVYTPFDEGGAWRQQLGQELQAAGYEVDWNKVMRR